MNVNHVGIAALLLGSVALAGCGHTAKTLGMTKGGPDEFRVVAKAPLVVPPDFSLRPPAPGEPRPQELQPESAAREALMGARAAEARSDGERYLVAKAGADRADPLARYAVDDEFGDIAHKDKSFADRVMFWKKGNASTEQPGAAKLASAADTPAPIDPATATPSAQSLTGGKDVVIRRGKSSFVKLPGL